MNTKLLSGTDLSNSIYSQLQYRINNLKDNSIIPSLAVILVGNNPASKVYVKNKTKRFDELGLHSSTFAFSDQVSEADLVDKINELNSDGSVHGILVQLPLPNTINAERILSIISDQKDVDGFHPKNLGYLSAGSPKFIPCTPKGIMRFFEHHDIKLSGKHVVVVGRSNIVGRPISILTSLKGSYANATTTICHSGSTNIFNYTRLADVIILALGKPFFLNSDHIKEGAVIIDVGINRIDSKEGRGILVGDADINSLKGKASAITPVPGGVGPMTIAMLVENTIEAAERLIKS